LAAAVCDWGLPILVAALTGLLLATPIVTIERPIAVGDIGYPKLFIGGAVGRQVAPAAPTVKLSTH
jgi:hypothetical protein